MEWKDDTLNCKLPILQKRQKKFEMDGSNKFTIER